MKCKSDPTEDQVTTPGRRRRVAGTAVGLAALALFATACSSSGSGSSSSTGGSATTAGTGSSGSSSSSGGSASQQLTNVTFAAVVAVPDPGQYYAFVPSEEGMFKQNGLNVTTSWNNGASTGVAQVVAGKAQFGTASPEAIWTAIAAGAQLTVFGEMVTKNIYTGQVLPGSPITSWAQLKGKKIGVRALTSGAYPSAEQAIAQAGLKNSDVQFVTVGTGGQAAHALQSHQVDALVTTDTDWAAIHELGVKTTQLPRSTAQSLPADVLYTTTAYYNAHKSICVAMGRAIYQSTQFSLEHPAQAITDYTSAYPDAAKAATPAQDQATLQARLDSHNLVPGENGKWGYLELSSYNQLQTLDLQYGVVKQKLDLSSFMTNELIPQIDDFNAGQTKSGS